VTEYYAEDRAMQSCITSAQNETTELNLRPLPARTGRTVFSQLSAAVVRHKANDGVVYVTRAWFKYDTAALSAVV